MVLQAYITKLVLTRRIKDGAWDIYFWAFLRIIMGLLRIRIRSMGLMKTRG